VVTSASSKVALAMALYMKNDPDRKFDNIKIVGYTSGSNMDFCRSLGLYDEVLSYDDMLSSSKKYTMVDIAGRGYIYTKNNKAGVDIAKLLVIGNSSGTDDKKSTFSTFSYYAMVKMALSMIVPSWLHSWMHPTQELYLIWEDMAVMEREWGKEKLNRIQKETSLMFCKSATKWMTVREAKTEEEIQLAFLDILHGRVPPTETIALNMRRALAHRGK